jgi:hypothetical protein
LTVSNATAFRDFFLIGCRHGKAAFYYANSVRGTINGPYVAESCTVPGFLGFQVAGKVCNATMGYFADVTTTNREDGKTFRYAVSVTS